MNIQPTSNEDDSYTKYFLLLAALLLSIILAIASWLIDYMHLTGFWILIQSALINMFASVFGFTGALIVLGKYNEHRQRESIKIGVRQGLDIIQDRTDALQKSFERELGDVHAVIASSTNWKDKYVSLQDVPYEQLFKNATEVGLLVQSWERWADERRKNLADLAKRGGRFTLILHDPDHNSLIDASAARWKLRVMDQKAQIANTVKVVEKIIPATQLQIVKRQQMIWYCLMRFTYMSPAETVYIISPYAHEDYPVNQIPAFIINKSLLPHVAEFFDQEWEVLIKE